jgi:hypothetical protein
MKPKYNKLFNGWEIPEKCWTETPKRGYSSILFSTEIKAKKAIKLFKKLGRAITPVDVWEIL